MRQIIVFSDRAPCGPDVAGLLRPEAGLDALGWETDLDQAIRRIRENRPPAVIVAGHDAATDCGPAVARIQAECPGIQVAEINLATRVVRIHSAEGQIVEELKELLSAVERRSASKGERGPAD